MVVDHFMSREDAIDDLIQQHLTYQGFAYFSESKFFTGDVFNGVLKPSLKLISVLLQSEQGLGLFVPKIMPVRNFIRRDVRSRWPLHDRHHAFTLAIVRLVCLTEFSYALLKIFRTHIRQVPQVEGPDA